MNFSPNHSLLEALEKYSNSPALLEKDETLTYSNLHHYAAQILIQLRSVGVQKGDLIVLDVLPAQVSIATLWACFLGGIIAFPFNTRFPESILLDVLEAFAPNILLSDRQIHIKGSLSSKDILAQPTLKPELNLAPPSIDKPATVLMTSGSSGASKFVQHSLRNHLSSAFGANQNIILAPGDRWLITLPLYHVGGLSILFRAALAGATVVIPDPAKSLSQNISDKKITHVSLVTTQLQRLLQETSTIEKLGQMKAMLLGGSAISPSLIKTCLQNNLPIHSSYGSTEMASQITTTGSNDRTDSLNNSGKILCGRDLIISHEGEILVKGETLAMGYRQGSELIELRDKGGWFHTGDVGYVDVKGLLTVTGRMDNQFISGGENIQPEHIERVLSRIEGVSQAMVIPQPDPEFGFRPIAFLTLENTSLSQQNIRTLLKTNLPGYLIPKVFYHIPPVLLSDGIKISRVALLKYFNDSNNHLHCLR